MLVDLLKFSVKDGDAAHALMKEQTVMSRGDEGCLFAHAFRSKENPDELYMIMAWDSKEAVEKHFQTEYDIKFREKIDAILTGPPEFFELIV